MIGIGGLMALAAALGYLAGRARPAVHAGDAAVDWADTVSARRGRRDPRWWAAQVVYAVGIGWMFAAHPRRTLANIRANRARKSRSAPIDTTA
ncbi:hypothetical protein [Streptomyces bohaiensis]|uniref:Uncharacterized protein n=1 Tax=Streptomyces bohaiensis TaxID=1431344 RepID=A0ABX1C9B9_9ACTN|nr:hypothetical protein [Streptomyces bohaiensis]NJQ14200.1 hypothetical protein [Streptomyces bohaiensis]